MNEQHVRRWVAAQAWREWCAEHQVGPCSATVTEVIDFVLDLKLAGHCGDDLVAALEHAGVQTGVWTSSRFATARLAL